MISGTPNASAPSGDLAPKTAPPSDQPQPIFAIHPSAKPFLLPPAAFIARHFVQPGSSSSSSTAKRPPAPTYLATGAIVFNRPLPVPGRDKPDQDGANEPQPRVLLTQRAPHDSMPLRWETPGGGCDPDDDTILHACLRELREEAGLGHTNLEAITIGPLVRCPIKATNSATQPVSANGQDDEPEWGEHMGGHFFLTRRGKLTCKFYFAVGVPEEEAKKVVLDPNEHVDYVWASEEEVSQERMAGVEGKVLKFTTKEQKAVLTEAFKLWK